jgi:hypothetical protein
VPKLDEKRGAPQPARNRLRRWLLATAGVACVGLGALGAVLPGLPTTIFLIIASWCFARSCPWLEERLVRVPLFRPFLLHLERAEAMPLRAVLGILAVMWSAIGVSTIVLLAGSEPRPVVAMIVVVAGLVGSFFVVRLRVKKSRATAPRTPRGPASRWSSASSLPAEAEEG